MEDRRCIESNKFPLIFSVIFWIIIYWLLFLYFDKEANISSYKLQDFYTKYTLYSPIVFWLLSLVIFYILAFIKFILRIKSSVVTILIYFIVYWFFLILWADLMFFEPRLADFAKLIIETFSIPLIASSSFILILVILLSLKKVKSKT
jgi:hypothetical protein